VVRIGSNEGFTPRRQRADMQRMIWPVAALAVFFLGFVVVYGSILQSRAEAGVARAARDEPIGEAESA
jgi:hypothetical protein